MAKRVQKRRGSPSEHAAFTGGAAGEITVELPTSRGSGSTQEYAAVYVHHGDNAVGDRIASAAEVNNTARQVVDEQRFLAKITGFRAIDDDGNTANPDVLPSRWEYRWEEVSISGGNADVAQVMTIALSGTQSSGGAESKNITLPKSLYGDTKDLAVNVDNGASAVTIATQIVSVVNGDSDVQYTASNNSGASSTVTFTGKIKGALKHPVMAAHTGVTVGDPTMSTVGTKYTAITTAASSADLSRSSDPGSDGTHEFAAVNLCELTNSTKFIGPGIGNGSTDIALQSANGPWPTNYKVVPIGGTASYGAAVANEPDTGSAGTAPYFSNTAVHYVVEMVERRKLDPGTAANQTVGSANTDGYNVFYYFQVPNAITGPC